jgi:hypothetical protein
MKGQLTAAWGFLVTGQRLALREHESPSASRRQLRPGRVLRQTAIGTAGLKVGSGSAALRSTNGGASPDEKPDHDVVNMSRRHRVSPWGGSG